MRDLAEVLDHGIHLAGLKIRMRRAPETKVDNRADAAAFQELLPARTQVAHPRNVLFPGLGQRAVAQVVHRVRMPQRRAEAESPVIAHRETAVASPAMEKVVAARVHHLRQDELIAPLLQGSETFLGGTLVRPLFRV